MEEFIVYILLNVAIGKEKEIADTIQSWNNNLDARVVYGEYDIVVRTKVDSLKKLEKLVFKIGKIPGVLRTVTLISTY